MKSNISYNPSIHELYGNYTIRDEFKVMKYFKDIISIEGVILGRNKIRVEIIEGINLINIDITSTDKLEHYESSILKILDGIEIDKNELYDRIYCDLTSQIPNIVGFEVLQSDRPILDLLLNMTRLSEFITVLKKEGLFSIRQ